jgi:hypothetical protein
MAKTNLYWPVYKNLEKELLNLSYNVYFDDYQFEYKKDSQNNYVKVPPYSLKIGELLIRCCTEIEALIQELTKGQDNAVKNTPSVDKTKPITIGCRLKYLHYIWRLDKKVVLVSCSNMFFESKDNKSFIPFAYNNNDDNDYYSAYNAIKHNRNDTTTPKGNIRFLLRAMAALYLLNIYYKDDKFSVKNLTTMNDFDASLGSDIFSIKLAQNAYINQINRTKWRDVKDADDYVYLNKYSNSIYKQIIEKQDLSLQQQKEFLLTSQEFKNFSLSGEKFKDDKNLFSIIQQIGIWNYKKRILAQTNKDKQLQAIFASSEYKNYCVNNSRNLEHIDKTDVDRLCAHIGAWNYQQHFWQLERTVQEFWFNARLDIVLNKNQEIS